MTEEYWCMNCVNVGHGGLILRVSKVSTLRTQAVVSKANLFALVALNKSFTGF
jgi:hypothetical protein